MRGFEEVKRLPAPGLLGLDGPQDPAAGPEDPGADGQVDEKDIRPAQVGGDDASQGGADADAGGEGGGKQAQGQAPFPFPVGQGNEFGGYPQHQRPPKPLQGPGGHHRRQAGADAAQGRGPGKDHQPQEKELARRQEVAQPAAGQEERDVHQEVDQHDPGDLDQRTLEIPGDLRQGDIDDAGVQGRHKGPQTDGQQDDAPVQGLSFRSRGRGRHGFLSYAKPRRSGRGFFGE